MKKSSFAAMLLCLGVAGCASEPVYQPKAHYDPLEKVPASFLEAHPNGTQSRNLDDIRLIFVRLWPDLMGLYQARLYQNPHLQGLMTVAFALDTSGTVRHIQLVESDLADSEFEGTISRRVWLQPFGPAEGEGLYVSWFSFRFANPKED